MDPFRTPLLLFAALACGPVLLTALPTSAPAAEAAAIPVRGVVPKARAAVVIDGRLGNDEYQGALCTPVEYFHPDVMNRAGQFYYLWDDEAFYVGLRTLDEKTYSPESPLWEGDAVEWYFDTRRGSDFLSRAWPRGPASGAVHCFFTAMDRAALEPRFTLRPGFGDAIPKTGVQVAAQRTEYGLEVEFKLPWVNFPAFQPAAGEVIGIDAELSYSDGGPRSDRSFVFGSPLSVQQPANLARIQLVDRLEPQHWRSAGAVMMPMRVDVPWKQTESPHVAAQIAMPPGRSDQIGRVTFQLVDLAGDIMAEFEAEQETVIQPNGQFATRQARWPTSVAAPAQYHVHAIVYDQNNQQLTRIAPRLTSVNMQQGY